MSERRNSQGSGDNNSEASYESVPSEGGYEPASERGRDLLPRIISASHCIEVYRKLRWADGAHFCRIEDSSKARQRNGQPRRPDPLEGFPDRILRFDGAIEAWLEELPAPQKANAVVDSYLSLNDAAAARSDLSVLRAGNRRATLWYFKPEFQQQLWPSFLNPDGSGPSCWQQVLLERSANIMSTHVEVGQVHAPKAKGGQKGRTPWLKAVFAAMQASKWTPDGEAKTLLAKRRISHASMSIGDVVQIGAQLYVAGLDGFVVMKGQGLLPAPLCLDESDGEQDSEASTEVQEANGDGSGQGKQGKKNKGKGKGEGGRKGKGKGKGGGKGQNAEGRPGPEGPRPDRADRRGLRAQLQAAREKVQGSH